MLSSLIKFMKSLGRLTEVFPSPRPPEGAVSESYSFTHFFKETAEVLAAAGVVEPDGAFLRVLPVNRSRLLALPSRPA